MAEDIVSESFAAFIEILSTEDLSFLFESEVAKIFKDFLATLPEQTKDIFMDSRFRGLTYNELAQKYGVTPRKVKREKSNDRGRFLL